ncbi:acyl-CoA dehydrogenase family protein [Streptomyces sp. NPDC055078]
MTMYFENTTDEAAYRERAVAWLAEHAPAFEDPGPERLSVFARHTPEESAELARRAMEWQATKHAGGWASIALPRELGGAGGTLAQSLMFAQEEGRYRIPKDALSVTMGMVAPTLARWGTQAQHQDFLAPIIAGRQLWCQLFSEPGAGSDLAGLETRARRRGEGWVVGGHKVWTSYAQFADYGYLLARTGEEPRHRGLTAFVVDMRAPGVTVEPLRQATGATTFNEVFLDDVVLPESALLGAVGHGWQVAMTTLMNERYALEPSAVPAGPLRALAEDTGTQADPAVRRGVARTFTYQTILDVLQVRLQTAAAEGRDPGPEGSVTKLLTTRGQAAATETAMLALDGDALLDNVWTEFAMGALGLRIGGGTDEILKNIIAERVLGLPRERAAS